MLELWENDCGVDIVYNKIRLDYERHMARELNLRLTELIKKWGHKNAVVSEEVDK